MPRPIPQPLQGAHPALQLLLSQCLGCMLASRPWPEMGLYAGLSHLLSQCFLLVVGLSLMLRQGIQRACTCVAELGVDYCPCCSSAAVAR